MAAVFSYVMPYDFVCYLKHISYVAHSFFAVAIRLRMFLVCIILQVYHSNFAY